MAHIVELESLSGPEAAPYAGLTERQRRSVQDIMIVESIPAIRSALAAGCEPLSMLAERRHIAGKAAELVREIGDVPVYTADDALLSELTGYALTRGVLCAMRRPAPRCADEVIAGGRRLALLEHVLDAANVGSAFRCAAGLGMDGLLLADGTCDPLSRRSIRVSMGGVFKLPFAEGSTRELLPALRGQGYRLLALVVSKDATPLSRFSAVSAGREERLCVLLGTEATGLEPDTIAACDERVTIPMATDMDSLNIAMAAAIAFWELGKVKG